MEFVFKQNRIDCEKSGIKAVFAAKNFCGVVTADEIGLFSREGSWEYFDSHSHSTPQASFVDGSETCLVLSYDDFSDVYLVTAEHSSPSAPASFSVQFQTTLQTRITAADGELLGAEDGRVFYWSVGEGKLEIKDLVTFDSEIVQISTRKSLALASTRTLAKVFAILDSSNQY